jgi:endonuclease/exonuclease/phosphatase family metal-dependent hydrolase
MRVVTWNLWGLYGPWAERQPVILEVLRGIDADVVCLQEAWRTDTQCQPEILATALGLQWVYAPAFEMNGGWSGNGILSRWPITNHDITELPMAGSGATDTDPGERRVLLFAELDAEHGPIQVFTTHFSWRADWSGVRQAQAAATCEAIAARRPRRFPAVLCGDFNAEPQSDEIRILTGQAAVPVPGIVFKDAWAARGEGPGFTISDANPYAAASLDDRSRIDYVLVGWPKAGGAGQVLAAWVAGQDAPGGVAGSDHYAVVAELRV